MAPERSVCAARELFEGISDAYERPAQLLSLGQYGRWRRVAVARLELPPAALVLDVATGTGLVARDLVRRRGARVVGLDSTMAMLRHARAPGVSLVAGRGEQLPFPDASFDGVAFTYLLRYVDEPGATLRELARVLRPGGIMASVEFGLPHRGPLRAGWNLYVRHLLPLASSLLSPGWRDVGRFLGPSISSFCERFPQAELEELWRRAGMEDVRTRRLTFGAGVVSWATKAS
jgi:demethylmenaquinone methyltransferase/2-methoxy-6-polyprenyl-1,4-benzoquinol methylase